ncbi:MAG TPA: PAS domain-containing protein, partial [Cyclobacteriaceae bacterium]|nr:PAS domain-containing protein [Cyclobacteriaceae bacterium]
LSFSGFSRGEIIGKTSADLGWITPEQRKLMIDTITTHGRIEGLEMAFKTKKGDIVYGIINGEKITIGNKNFLLITTADITARKKVEQALSDARIKAEESEKRFANAIAATSDAVWELNLQTEQGFGSPRWYEMLGYDNNEIKMNSESWRKLCHPDDLQATNERIAESVANSTSFTIEYRMRKKDGQWIWVMGRGKVVKYDEQGRPLLLSGTNTDITERRQLILELEQHQNHLEKLVSEKTDEIATANEELISTNDILFEKNKIIQEQNLELNEALQHLRETQTQLIQTEKLASLGVLTAGVAHEINNPLNYIMGAYEGLSVILKENQQINDPDIQKLLSSLKSGVDRVSKIVKGLNQFSRNTEQLDEQCDIPAIIENCLTILKKEYKDRIEVNTQFPSDSVIISGNVGKLHQVFTNVIGNAIQAIEKNGTIQIIVSKNKAGVLIELVDNGCGISKENLNKILEPFFTTKDPGKGTGLGLSISYAIIKEHNGTLKFDSKVNEGTSVKINLPLKLNNN